MDILKVRSGGKLKLIPTQYVRYFSVTSEIKFIWGMSVLSLNE